METPQVKPSSFLDRKVWSAGLAGFAAWAILTLAAHYAVTIPIDQALLAEFISGIATVVMGATAYYVPPTAFDVVKRLNKNVIEFAKQSPDVSSDVKVALGAPKS